MDSIVYLRWHVDRFQVSGRCIMDKAINLTQHQFNILYQIIEIQAHPGGPVVHAYSYTREMPTSRTECASDMIRSRQYQDLGGRAIMRR